MNQLWYIGIMLLGGLLFGRIAKLVNLPNVTGYLIAGLILGPHILKIIPAGTVEEFEIIADVALGFISFSIGGEFKLSYIKRVGMTPVVIACLEAFFATAFVTIALVLAGQPLAFSIVLGAIAAATAPAATVMVIRQYKAKGPVTDTLLTVVALDDAAALMLFGIAAAISQQLTSHADTGLLLTIAKPVLEIVCALLLGGALGFLFMVPLRYFKKSSNRLSVTIAFVFVAAALSKYFDLSALLVCMAMGTALVNASSQAGQIMQISDDFTPPILLLFFVLSGSELDVSVLPTIGLVGVIYVIMRVIGKCTGVMVASKIMKASPEIAKYLGPALIPQAGVAIGLSLLATTLLPTYGPTIRAVILCATFIYEIIGPAIAKTCLQRAGEIQP